MGTGTSRGKKVAPVRVSEVSVTKNSSQFKPLETHTILRNARNSARPDCHREGHDSPLSREDDDVDGELDTVLEDYGDRERASVQKTPQKRSFIKSRKYGLCHFSREDKEDDVSCAPPGRASGRAEEPRVPRGVTKDVNKRSNPTFKHLKQHTPAFTKQYNVRYRHTNVLDQFIWLLFKHLIMLIEENNYEPAHFEITVSLIYCSVRETNYILYSLCFSQPSSQSCLAKGTSFEAVPTSEKQP